MDDNHIQETYCDSVKGKDEQLFPISEAMKNFGCDNVHTSANVHTKLFYVLLNSGVEINNYPSRHHHYNCCLPSKHFLFLCKHNNGRSGDIHVDVLRDT